MKQAGQIFILAIVVFGLIVLSSLVLTNSSLLFWQNSATTAANEEAINLAEAGVDKAVASLNATSGSYNGEGETPLGAGSYSVSVTSLNSSTYLISSTGYIPNKTNPTVSRVVKVQVSKGVGVSFVYALLTGNGGILMGNNATINGSVYSNGNITGGNGETITGDAYVAGGTQPSADQASDCSVPNCSDFLFGTTVSGNSVLDVAQSFKPTQTESINKVSLKLKKIGLPSNPIVRLLSDANGVPDKNNVLASGTLSANLVTNQYGYVDVTFSQSPILTVNTPYWIMIAIPQTDSSNYWSWSEDTLAGYTRGSSLWSSNWQAHSPLWGATNASLGFKTWMGGVTTSISMGNGSVVGGSAHANTINTLTINKDAYYQVINNSLVKGTSYPNSADPPPIAMPVSAANITQWQSQAQGYGTSVGDITGCPSKIGAGKIIGNLTPTNNCTITVTTPLWVTGNLGAGNGVIFKMDPSLGSSSGMIIVDGTSSFANGNDLLGTGVSGSYLMLLSTYNSQSNQITAINGGNGTITGILYAPYGILALGNGGHFKEADAWQINLGNSATLTYDQGLVNTFFSAGPGGSFSVVSGTYSSQ